MFEMIQFDEQAFFKWVGEKPPPDVEDVDDG